MPPATREFCTVNAKYQLHILLREISHPSNENNNLFPIPGNDPSIETLILTLSQREFSNHVKKAYESFSNWRTIPVQDIKSDLVFDIYDNLNLLNQNFKVNIDMSF